MRLTERQKVTVEEFSTRKHPYFENAAMLKDIQSGIVIQLYEAGKPPGQPVVVYLDPFLDKERNDDTLMVTVGDFDEYGHPRLWSLNLYDAGVMPVIVEGKAVWCDDAYVRVLG